MDNAEVVAILISLLILITLGYSYKSRPKSRRTPYTPASTSRHHKQAKRGYTRDELTFRMKQRIDRETARTRLAIQLEAPPLALITLLRQRAIQLYQEQNDVSYAEAVRAIIEVESNTQSAQKALAEPLELDPVVTILLLKAGYTEDALDYFVASTGASYEEAQDAIAHLQTDIASEQDLWLFNQPRTPQAALIRYLLSKGHTLIAARYYRDCTDVSLSTAQQAIREYI